MRSANNNKNRQSVESNLLWDDLPGDKARKYIILALLLLLALVAMVLVETTQVPEQSEADEEVPDRMAELVMKRQEEPEPEPREKQQEEEEEKEQPDEEKDQEEPPAEEQQEEPEPSESDVQKAREKARRKLSVFDKKMEGLEEMAPDGTEDSGGLRDSGSSTTEAERDLISSRAGEGSGGVQTGSVSSSGTGGEKLKAEETEDVESDIARKSEEQSTNREGRSGASERTREQIRRVFDRYAGRMQSVYVRARRRNPTLKGTIVLDLTIAPSGKVQDVEIKSSELDAPKLKENLLVIVQTIDFGERDVETWNGDWTLNFFPG